MALTEDQKKLLIGGGVGALALAVGFVIFGGKAAAAPAPVSQSPQRGQPPQRFQPSQQRIPTRGLERKRKKRRHDDDNDRGDRGENGRGEYGRKKHGRHRRDD